MVWSVTIWGGNQLHSQLQSEGVQSFTEYLSLWRLSIKNCHKLEYSVNNRTRSAVNCAADCHLYWLHFLTGYIFLGMIFANDSMIFTTVLTSSILAMEQKFQTHRTTDYCEPKAPREKVYSYSTPSTEGVESTRGNSVCLSVCLSVCVSVCPFVRNHFFLFRIFNNLMI